jgi:hypothetical protein
MSDAALEAGKRAVMTFLEAEFVGCDVTLLAAAPSGRTPADALYYRIADDDRTVGTVGVTPDALRALSTTALVERLHAEDLAGAVRAAGPAACVLVTAGAKPAAVPLG